MVSAITSVSTIAAVTAAAPELSLQPGTVVDAQVVQVLKNDLVRIALQGVLIDALSEVPLQAGQSLKLAVSETPQGVRLSVVPAADKSQVSSTQTSAAPSAVTTTTRPQATTNASQVTADVEAQAVAVATQTAASRQSGLSQLFANLGVAAKSDAVPLSVRQVAAGIIALQPALDQSINGSRLQQAVAASGVFREAMLAQGQVASTPDIKSALMLLRQTLSIVLGDTAESALTQTQQTQASATQASASLPARTAIPVTIVNGVTISQGVDDAPFAVRPLTEPEASPLFAAIHSTVRPNLTPSNVRGVDGLTQLVHTLLAQGAIRTSETPSAFAQSASGAHVPEPQGEVARTNVPPPPFRGAATSAQAVMPSTLTPDTPPAAAVKQLLEDTNGAIARQTLLQIASLPDRVESGAKLDVTQPRWSLEIPFATPQGTAVAQFEIARDGGGSGEIASAKRVWRARFSLDVEPAGPVHAIVSLAGETASVRMWAERPLTAARLRAGSAELAHALQSAALQPGDIVIGEGAPPQAGAPPAGHFVNRAS